MSDFGQVSFTAADGTTAAAYTDPSSGATLIRLTSATGAPGLQVSGNKLGQVGSALSFALYRESVAPAGADYSQSVNLVVSGSLPSPASWGPAVRMAAAAVTGYFALYDAAASLWQIYRCNAGSFTALTPTYAHSLVTETAKLRVSGTGATVTLVLSIDGSDVLTVSDTHADRVVSAGYPGFWWNQGAASSSVMFDSMTPNETSVATAITLSGPSSGTISVASTNFTVGANGPITGTITVTPTDSSGAGSFTPATVNISAGTPTATLTYTPTTTGARNINCTNNGGLSAPSNVAYTSNAAATVTPGVASMVSTTATTINASCTAASDGTAPYTYQWYRSTTSGFTPGAGNLLAGETSLTLADTASLVTGTAYYYVCKVTDDVASTANSNQIAGSLKDDVLSVGFMGDSITNGYALTEPQGPVSQSGLALAAAYSNLEIVVTEYGVNSSKTADWLSGSANLIAAKAAFAAASATHVHIMLGANDAGAADLVPAATYKSNLQNIIADLNGAGYTVILSYPLYIPAGANGGATNAASVALAIAYLSEIDSLVNGTTVLQGDTAAYAYFEANLSEYQADQTHPTSVGAASLGQFWATAIATAIFTVTSVFVKVAGTYRPAMSVHTKVAGVYKLANEIYMKQSGTYVLL